MEIWTLKPNAVITEQDRDDCNIYIIKSGVAKVSLRKTTSNGEALPR